MNDVVDRDVLDAMRVGTTLKVRPVYAPRSDIDWLLDKHFRGINVSEVSDEDLQRHRRQYAGRAETTPSVHLAASDNVIVRLADQIIAEACRERASDIHIEPLPGQGDTTVRVRIDGRMFVRRRIPWMYRDALVSRYKVMASLNVADHRRPQDGKIVFQRGGTPIELRVATLPTSGGVEDVVLRVLDSSTALPLEALGLRDEDHERLRTIIEKPHGIMLVCGPTGSGKTTSLHSVLRHLNDGTRKIWTAENPVEITQAGLRQVEVNPKAGLTFANALRAFLRADPDVIMVGEIRDTETAKTALEASLTGHLVLSTLHTNSAPESVVRLLEMGMNPFNFADSLLGVLAQRLARCLCKHCRASAAATDDQLQQLAIEYLGTAKPKSSVRDDLISGWLQRYGDKGKITLYSAQGCSECTDTGYKGRIGLFELMDASAEIKRAVIRSASAAELFEMAMSQGMSTLKQDGIHKVLAGVTDLSQVLAVSQR
jgi:type II secretory ATPase GspE/PulE/Tfp pilus assembly ATPase PilB-like protein